MKWNAQNIARWLRYIGVTLIVLTLVVCLFLIADNQLFENETFKFLYYGFFPYSLLYAQLFHITRNTDKNLDNVIVAHFITIAYCIGLLFYISTITYA